MADSIVALLPKLRSQIPAGIHLDVTFNRADPVRESVHDVQFTLMLSIALVVMAIFLFLRNVRATLIPSLALPASILVTFGAMSLFGFSLDNLSLMALTLCTGFVVDDAIVVLENIVRRMELGDGPMEAALKGSKEIGFTVLSMTLSLVAVFIPVLFMGGIIGRLFFEFGVTISVAIVISGFISLSLTPMLASRLLKKHNFARPPGAISRTLEQGFEAIKGAYERTLDAVLRHRLMTLAVAFVILGIAIWAFGAVGKGFIPTEDIGLITASTEGKQGISFDEMKRHQLEVNQIVQANPHVAAVMSNIGAGGKNGSMNAGSLNIRLVPLKDRPSSDQIIQDLRRKLAKVIGIRSYMQTPPAIRIGGMQSKGLYQLTLQSLDTKQLYAAVPGLLAALGNLPELQDVNSDLQLSSPQADVKIDRARASALGVSAQAIENALQEAYSEQQVSTLYTSTDQYKVIMELDPRFQLGPSALEDLYVHSTSGKLIPLSEVTQVVVDAGPALVNHLGPFAATTVSFNLKPGVSLSTATGKVMQIARQILPSQVTPSFQGSAQAFQSSLASLGMLLLLAIVVIYIVLGILYESFIHPITVLSGLPSAGLGALCTLMLFGKDLDVYGFVGLIMLIGIVKKNAIILIDFALEAQRTEGKTPEEAIREACSIRFRPIMMTTLAALAGTLPIALGLGAGGDARQPLGLAVVGGLMVSQLLTLYLTPVVYIYLDRLHRLKPPSKRHGRFSKAIAMVFSGPGTVGTDEPILDMPQ